MVMNEIYRYIISFLRLIRISNLLIIAGTQVLVRYCVLNPLLRHHHMDLQLPDGSFVLLVIATVFTAAAGYAINDYFDRRIDRVNKPESLIVGRLIYPRHAMAYHLFFSITGALIGTWVSYRAGLLYLCLVFYMVSGLLWFYSTTYKREFLLGNVIVALLTALVPFLVLLYELPLLARTYGHSAAPVVRNLMTWFIGFSFFAFLLNFVREIVKDAEDFEGDQAYGKRTVPVVWGMIATRWLSMALVAVSILLLGTAWYFFIPDKITLWYFIVLLAIPLAVVIIMIYRAQSSVHYHLASTVIKVIMLLGLLYMIVVNFIISGMQ
jgi:4-hydroxybenzoate polyprenyltransferase